MAQDLELQLKIEVITEQAQKSIENLKKSIEGINASFKKLSGGSLEDISESADNAEASLSDVDKSAARADESLSSLGDSADKADDSLKSVGDSAEETEETVEKVGDSANKTEGSLVRLTKAFSALGEKLSSIGEKAEALGSKLTTRVTAPIVAFGAIAVREFGKAEEASRRLETSIANSGKNFNLDKIKQLSSEIQKTTIFSDEDVQNAAANLITVGKVTEENLEKAINASKDFAAFTGQALPDASAALARAVTEPGEGLRVLFQAGIRLKDEQKQILEALVATGRGAEAQAFILDSVASKVDGVANKLGGTPLARLTQLKNAVGDLFEGVGDQIVIAFGPIIERVTTFARSATEALSSFSKNNPELSRMIVILTAISAAAGPIVLAFGAAAKVFGLISGSIATALGALKTFVAFLGASKIGVLFTAAKTAVVTFVSSLTLASQIAGGALVTAVLAVVARIVQLRVETGSWSAAFGIFIKEAIQLLLSLGAGINSIGEKAANALGLEGTANVFRKNKETLKKEFLDLEAQINSIKQKSLEAQKEVSRVPATNGETSVAKVGKVDPPSNVVTEKDKELAAKRAELRAELSKLKQEIDQINGTPITPEVARERASVELESLRSKLREAGILTPEAENTIKLNVEAKVTLSELDSVKQKVALFKADLELAKGALSKNLTTEELFFAENAIIEQNKAKIAELVQRISEVQALIKDPAQIQELEKLKQELGTVGEKTKELSPVLSQFRDQAIGAIASGFTQAFDEFISGTERAGRAFEKFAVSVLKQIAQIALQLAITEGLKKAFSTTAATGGYVNDGKITHRYAAGGMVNGPGSGTSDSIVARVSNGEFISDAATVRHFGPEFFVMLKRMARAGEGFKAFAEGGLVSGLSNLRNTLSNPMIPRFQDGGLAQAPTNMAPVQLQVINKGSEKQATDQRFDPKTGVVQIFLDDMRSGGPISRAIGGTFGLNR